MAEENVVGAAEGLDQVPDSTASAVAPSDLPATVAEGSGSVSVADETSAKHGDELPVTVDHDHFEGEKVVAVHVEPDGRDRETIARWHFSGKDAPKDLVLKLDSPLWAPELGATVVVEVSHAGDGTKIAEHSFRANPSA